MAWARLDDALIDHDKVFLAGAEIGTNGPGLVIGFFGIACMWSNKHLTDGFLPRHIVSQWPHFNKPLAVADALVRAGLLEKATKGTPPRPGFLIHDFGDYNLSASTIKHKRKQDRERKRANGASA